jgi:hypothetical protein
VEALSFCRLFVFDPAHYYRVLQEEPTVCFRQYWDTARRFDLRINSERSARFDDLAGRVVALLASYAMHFGEPCADGSRMDPRSSSIL